MNTRTSNPQAALYLAACTPYLWSRPHYRALSYSDDVRKNLQNVALPGTGLALSAFCAHRWLACAALVVVPPLAALAGALQRGARRIDAFLALLLAPAESWFHAWQTNCRLAALHAALSGERGYALEDKLLFLQEAEVRPAPKTAPAAAACVRPLPPAA